MTPLASSADLATLAECAGRAGRLGIDTEFMSEGRYRPLLCLVQVVAPDGESGDIALADPLVADAPDFAPLARALADPSVEVVVHAGRQDVAILRREWDTEVTALFDTQVAAGFAGFAAQAGYGSLLSGALRLTVPKTASYTRWDARPLTEEQLSYARGDVEHLLQLRDELARRLTRAGRLDWALEECRALAVSSDVRDPLECWRRLPKVTSLSARQRAVARELAAWRERTAEEQDKPVGSIVQDAALVEIARRQPRDPGALGDIRGVHQGIVRRRGKEIAAAVERGRVAEPIPGERGQGRATRATRRWCPLRRVRPHAGARLRARVRAGRHPRGPRADRRGRASARARAGCPHAAGLAPRAGGRGSARAAAWTPGAERRRGRDGRGRADGLRDERDSGGALPLERRKRRQRGRAFGLRGLRRSTDPG